VDVSDFDAQKWTSITSAQIADGVEQIQAGLTQNGSLAVETWETLSAAEIKSGSTQIQNSITITGTYLWEYLAASEIRNGTTQIQDSVTITGKHNVPVAASGTANTVDLNAIKEQVRFIFADTNTTTGSPIDLSANMVNRVTSILKINPDKITLADYGVEAYPAITIWTDRKAMTPEGIAKNQVTAKRESVIDFKIAGMVWNSNIESQVEDPADEDLENLMENVERVLRSYHDLGGLVRWQMPVEVDYFLMSDEESHFRVGVMTLRARKYY